MLWAIVLLLFIGVGWSLFRYYRAFLASEPVNRAILFACEDALALLNELGVEEVANDVSSYQSIASAIGCTLLPECKSDYLSFMELRVDGEQFKLVDSLAYKKFISAQQRRDMFFQKVRFFWKKDNNF